MRDLRRGACIWMVVLTLTLFAVPVALSAEDEPEGCVEPAKGPIGVEEGAAAGGGQAQAMMPVRIPTAQVGKPAPDFEANGFVSGKFKNVRLSDYKGQWVVLCFYPGDFTFV